MYFHVSANIVVNIFRVSYLYLHFKEWFISYITIHFNLYCALLLYCGSWEDTVQYILSGNWMPHFLGSKAHNHHSKDLRAGICTNPQKGPQCMNRMIDLSDWCSRCIVCARLMHEKNTGKDYHRRDNNLFNYLFIYYNLMANKSKCTHRQSPKDNL